MTPYDYKIIQQFLSQSCGIILGESKQYLVKNRLASVLTKFELATFSALSTAIQSNNPMAVKLKIAVVDAMTTNETFWFRDDMQFLELRETILPEVFNKKSGTIRVWSAACSSGQEPYTISMCVDDTEKKAGKNRNVQIIGTDISETILKEAKAAVYSEMALSRGMNIQAKNRYFQKIHDGYKLNMAITKRVRFQQFNLLKPFSVLGQFDVIFCRNVLIYFSDEVKKNILNRMVNSLEIGGYLFLSSTEAMPDCIEGLSSVRDGKAHYFKKVY